MIREFQAINKVENVLERVVAYLLLSVFRTRAITIWRLLPEYVRNKAG